MSDRATVLRINSVDAVGVLSVIPASAGMTEPAAPKAAATYKGGTPRLAGYSHAGELGREPPSAFGISPRKAGGEGRRAASPGAKRGESGERQPAACFSALLGSLQNSGGSGMADVQVEMGIGPPTGAAFPSWELRDQAGQAIDLIADRAGRGALVVFHRSAAW